MKSSILILFISLCSLQAAFSENIEAFIDYCIFHNPEYKSYVEVYMSISGKNIKFIKKGPGYVGQLEIGIYFIQDSLIKAHEKYELTLNDTSADKHSNFLDLKRMFIAYGHYTLQVNIKDLNQPENSSTFSREIHNDSIKDQLTISDIQLIDSAATTNEKNIFYKNGYCMYPYPLNFYDTNKKYIRFYAEIYNSDNSIGINEDFLINCSIVERNTNKVVNNLNKFLKQKTNLINIIFSEFDISTLPSGNYDIRIELKDKNNKSVKEQRLFFQKSNTNIVSLTTDKDLELSFVNDFTLRELLFDLRAIRPIAHEHEKRQIDNLLTSTDIKSMKRFFLDFWVRRNDITPTETWIAYAKEVKKVNENYGTQISEGFETQRGRVYLQYGPPNNIVRSFWESESRPYEIWTYNSIENGQTNIKFIFVARNTVTNDYELAYSNAQNEISDPSWANFTSKVLGRDQTTTTSPALRVGDPSGNGSRFDELFNQ